MRRWLLLVAIGAGCGRAPSTAPGPESNAGGGAEASRGSLAASADPDAPADADSSRSSASGEVDAPADADSPSVAKTPEASGEDTDASVSARAVSEVLAAEPGASTSVGSPTSGRLEGSVALPAQAPGLLFLPSKDLGSRFGTVELVQGLVKAAAAVEHADPGPAVTIGDLAREAGGDISGHASHRSGRDVDVLFYLVREDGQPFVPSKFIPLDPEGNGTDYGDLADPSDDVPVRLDAARTWRFVAALLADDAAAVQKILIVEHLRGRLLEEARRAKAPPHIVQRFSEVTCQPRFPHDDHMHIRVFCSAQDIEAGCEDTRPIFPWRRRALAEAGVKPVLAGKTPKTKPKPKAKLKTIEQARAEAGPMHQDVVDFLDRRQAWAHKPHPGRRWCR